MHEFVPHQDSRLCLNGVEGLEVSVDGLILWVAQRGDGERLQVQQLCGCGVLLWKDKVPEGDWQGRLALQELVTHHLISPSPGNT